jgi:hypothetical protein
MNKDKTTERRELSSQTLKERIFKKQKWSIINTKLNVKNHR